MKGKKYTIFETAYGLMGLVISNKGICGLVLPADNAGKTKAVIAKYHPDAIIADLFAAPDTIKHLKDYFDGKVVEFPEKLDLDNFTAFQRLVWEAARKVSYGQVTTYGTLAAAIGKPEACRAVGGALARNPIPIIIPCHRVIASDGSLGGFRDGLEYKHRLLELEGYKAKNNPV